MKHPSLVWWSKHARLLFSILSIGILLYAGLLLYQGFSGRTDDPADHLLGFTLWLSGYAFVFAMLLLLAWFNYRYPFRWLIGTPWLYRSWLIVLWLTLFEWLRFRTDYEQEWVAENLLVAVLGVSIVGTITWVWDAQHTRHERAVLRNELTRAELANLRAQLHPHFLFNVLNTIYSEALLQGQEKLSTLIGELADLLRFLLQQSQQGLVSISDEQSFWKNISTCKRPDYRPTHIGRWTSL
ncbi:MAG: histidine kinase [Saprospiraceae bacterium]